MTVGGSAPNVETKGFDAPKDMQEGFVLSRFDRILCPKRKA